jgi:hypothetical protein
MTGHRQIADPLKALCAFLREQIGDMVAITPGNLPGIPAGIPAVFRPDVPVGFDQMMPTECVILRPAGGYKRFGRTQIYMADPLVDLLSYGATQQAATQVCQVAITACKQLNNELWENVHLCSAQVAGGPIPMPDAQTLWPMCWASLQVTHGELPVK